MASLNHPNIVRYFDSFLDDGKLNIIMEYCDQGDLQQFLKKFTQAKVFVREEQVWEIFLQIAIALHYLHSQRILHRDMKSANVFMCKSKVRHHLPCARHCVTPCADRRRTV